QVVRLLARRSSESAELQSLRARLAADDDSRVRYQWLLEFAPHADPAAVDTLAIAAQRRQSDSPTDRQWIARALSLVHSDAAAALVERLLTSSEERGADAAALEPE